MTAKLVSGCNQILAVFGIKSIQLGNVKSTVAYKADDFAANQFTET